MKRLVLPNVVALAAGLTVGLIVGSAVVSGAATLVFACLLAARDEGPGRRR